MKRILFIIFFAICYTHVVSQTLFYETHFGTAVQDFSRSVVQINSGNLFILGNSASGNLGDIDISLLKLDKYGNELWTEYYGDANLNNGYCIVKSSDGNLVFAGDAQVTPGDADILIYKIDTLGGIVWQYTHSTAFNESVRYIEQTSDGGYIAAGFQTDSFGYNNSFVLKLNAAGAYQWSKSIGGINNDYASMIRQFSPTSYILTADTKSHGAGGYDVELSKLDLNGNVVWQYTYGDSLNNGCQGVFVSQDGNFISFGETEISPFSYFDMFMEKIDTNGVSVWKKYYGDSNRADACFAIAQNVAGDYFLTGYSNTFNGGEAMDLALIRTDINGNFIWGRGYGSAGVDIGYSIIPSMDNGFYITGKYFDTLSNDDEYYLLHLDEKFGGISEIKEDMPGYEDLFSIYPNPSKGKFKIAFDSNFHPGVMSVFSIEGILLWREKVNVGSSFVDVDQSFLPGVYFVQLQDEKCICIKKMVIN